MQSCKEDRLECRAGIYTTNSMVSSGNMNNYSVHLGNILYYVLKEQCIVLEE